MLYPSHRRRICPDRQLQRGLCNATSHSFLNANGTGRQSAQLYPRQSSDAILYASLVALFYAAIILIVVGSNCHRFRKQHNLRSNKRTSRQLIAVTDKKLNIFHIVLKGHAKTQPVMNGKQPIAIV